MKKNICEINLDPAFHSNNNNFTACNDCNHLNTHTAHRTCELRCAFYGRSCIELTKKIIDRIERIKIVSKI